MEPRQTLYELEPDGLPPGTEVGSWRVLALRGKGAYGATYLVEPVEGQGPGRFALKLALHPEDPRFEREVELLSRIHHPSVPRLVGRGVWAHPTGSFPFIVMEWVEGMPLEIWAREHKPSWRQLMRVLAQVARALEATHAMGGVHRDVKEANVLLRPEDGKATLLDFGAGDFRGAQTLTREVLPPGTPQYRSPEARCYQWLHFRQPGKHYEPGPADDVYALGVTAFQLVTGSYPPPAVDPKAAVEGRIVLRPIPKLPRAVVAVCPELVGLVRQMLSVEPAARGSAMQVAQALEHAAEVAGPGADLPIPRWLAQVPEVRTGSSGPWHRGRTRTLKLAVAVGSMAFLAMYSGWSAWRQWVRPSGEEAAEQGRDGGVEDAGTGGLAEESLPVSVSMERPEPRRATITLEVPKEPLPGQRTPPCEKRKVVINGGCWVEPKDSRTPCEEGAYEWKGVCYYPVFAPRPPPTSESP